MRHRNLVTSCSKGTGRVAKNTPFLGAGGTNSPEFLLSSASNHGRGQ